MTKVRYVGLDVHRDSITIATADEGRTPAMKFKTIPNDWPRLFKALPTAFVASRGKHKSGCIGGCTI